MVDENRHNPLLQELLFRGKHSINTASWVALVVKNLPANAGDIQDDGSIPGQEDPLEEAWQLTPVLLPGESHGQRSLAGYSPWDRKSQTRIRD